MHTKGYAERDILYKASQVGDDVFMKTQAEINKDFLKRIEALESSATDNGGNDSEVE